MNLKKVTSVVLLATAVSMAQSGLKGGSDGLHQQNAWTLGQWGVSAGLGMSGTLDSWAMSRGGIYSVNGKTYAMPKNSPSFDFNLYAAVGLLPFLDIGLSMPYYYDHIDDGMAGAAELWAAGFGDLELWTKIRAPFLKESNPFQVALLLQMSFPTGETGYGARVRHVWYMNDGATQAFTADQIILSASLIGTADLTKIDVPLRFNAYAGYVATIDYGANTLIWGAAANYIINPLLDAFLEFNAETRIEETHIPRMPYDLDPMVLTPGVRFHLPYHIDVALGLDIGLKNFNNPTFDTEKEMEQGHGFSIYHESEDGIKSKTYVQNEAHYGVSALIGWRLGGSTPKDSDGDGIDDKKDLCPHTPKDAPIDEKGCPLDSDKDSIPDFQDKCPNTPQGVAVDSIGCPLDSDKDGIPDSFDKCLNTQEGTSIDSTGCPLDSDKDGVPDSADKCPNTKEGITVDSTGCPADSDKDGVADSFDKCPNTKEGVSVDSTGCPLDSDKDGVPDSFDKCPNSKEGITVDSTGCPADSDKDGVADSFDKCPNTKEGVSVDSTGCPLDSDKDGVPDSFDKCPNSQEGEPVDSTGCPLDSDQDGVPDISDKCPNTLPGVKIDNKGCPVNKKQDLSKLKQGIQFKSNSAELTKASYATLDDIVRLLNQIPQANLEVQGHTDNTGSEELNNKLSQERAQTVVNYFVKKGISSDRVRAVGFGSSKPIADNKTKKGRTQNRRVELVPFQKD